MLCSLPIHTTEAKPTTRRAPLQVFFSNRGSARIKDQTTLAEWCCTSLSAAESFFGKYELEGTSLPTPPRFVRVR